MSIYSQDKGKNKKWRYDFMVKGQRYSSPWFDTKQEAKQAEADRRKEVLNPKVETQTPTDMDFLELVNRRLDFCESVHLKAALC